MTLMAEAFELKIITPERVFYSGQVTFVEFTASEGKVGIYRGHEAMTMLLSPGVLIIHEKDGTITRAALHTGFAEITEDRVSVLAELAEWPEEIDRNRAEQAKIRAARRLQENGSNRLDELALRRAIARIEALKNTI